jgi:hypothetical protein
MSIRQNSTGYLSSPRQDFDFSDIRIVTDEQSLEFFAVLFWWFTRHSGEIIVSTVGGPPARPPG